MQIKDLTKEQLWELRQEIELNSLYLRDYNNSFNIDTKECKTFFDGYVKTLYMFAGIYKKHDFIEIVNKYDNIENLYGFWCEIYGDW